MRYRGRGIPEEEKDKGHFQKHIIFVHPETIEWN
jgi:hypothetical protein